MILSDALIYCIAASNTRHRWRHKSGHT